MHPQAAAITDNWPVTIGMLIIGAAVIAFFMVRSRKK